jgi:hypothetical protein
MAKEWTVTPSEGVVNNNDGTFSFPANDTFCDKTYIIEYKDTGDGCTCNAVFTQVGKECKTTSGSPIWDDYDCSLYPGRDITVDGYYWVYPRHLEGCSTCIDDPSYSASTSMTVSCPVPCTPYAAGESYSWCSESSQEGTCAYVGCVDGDLSGIDVDSISVSVTGGTNIFTSGFSVEHDEGENYYRIRAEVGPMPCDGSKQTARLRISVNGQTFNDIESTQWGCKPECKWCNQCD